jgi:hypothetical protein
MAWTLARQEGLFAGTSTGLNVVGALQLARELGAGHTVVTVAVDSGLQYLAGTCTPARHRERDPGLFPLLFLTEPGRSLSP